MQYLAKLGNQPLKFYYNTKVYSPQYSSLDPVWLADKLIKDGEMPKARVLDVGCGAGVLGLSLKSLQPETEVMLTDLDPEAVRITRLNAKRLGLEAGVYQTNLLPPLGNWQIILTNLPTYNAKQMVEEPLYGPETAYNGGGDGLHLYEELFKQARGRCKALVCECQTARQRRFLQLAETYGYTLLLKTKYGFAFLAP